MSELANYSVETDEVVLLIFQDGSRRRVAANQLDQYLEPFDAARVGAALKLRHRFLRLHMPKAVVAFVAGSAIAMLALASKPLATLWVGDARSATETPRPGTTELVHNTETATKAKPTTAPSSKITSTPKPSISQPTPSPSPAPHSGILASVVHAIVEITKDDPISSTQVAEPSPSPQPSPSPSVSPDPTPIPTMIPSPTPGPIVIDPNPTPQPGAGQVLGDSTNQSKQSTPIPKT